MEERLQKILAGMGVASRRKAEEFILHGRVTVNGKTAVLGMKVNPLKDHIKLDGKLLTKAEPKVYFMFNKPSGVVTSLSDPEGRKSVRDFLGGIKFRVYPVGRLDYDSEGLLLMTNDGDFANAVMHPSRKIPKTYLVKVKGVPGNDEIAELKRGVKLEDGMTAPAGVKRVRQTANNSWLEITIHEGRNRQVRRMFDRIGHSVIRLKRISIDGLRLNDLKPGELRKLTDTEVKELRS